MFDIDDLLMPALVSSVLGGGFALMLILSAHDSNPPLPSRIASAGIAVAEQSAREQARDTVRPGVRPLSGRPSGGR